MVNKIILVFLFLPLFCFAQNRLIDKSLSRFEVNFNTGTDLNSTLYSTYSLTDEIKPLIGLDLHVMGPHYNLAPAAGIMIQASEQRLALYSKIQAGPNFSLEAGSRPGLFFKAGVGLQYAITNSVGINTELFYRRANYFRERTISVITYTPAEGYSYLYSGTEIKDNTMGLALGLNYRFGSGKNPGSSTQRNHGEENFWSKVDLNFGASLNVPTEDYGGASYAGYNAFATYAVNDNFKMGGGFEYTKQRELKYYSGFLTGAAEAPIKNFALFTRLSAGANFFDNKKLSPGLMLSLAAGAKYKLTDRVGVTFEASLKNLTYGISTPYTSTFDDFQVTVYREYFSGSRMFGFSGGMSMRLGK